MINKFYKYQRLENDDICICTASRTPSIFFFFSSSIG